MSTEVDICNIALARIGISQTIVDLATEKSKEARLCRQFYELSRDIVLEKVPWPFAVKAQALALISDATAVLVPGWSYQYATPVDLAAMLEIVPSGEVGAALGYYTNCACDAPWMGCRTSRYDYRRALSGDGNSPVILAGIDDAYAIYVAKVSNTEAYSAQMVSLVADRLAMELSMPMMVDPRYFQMAQGRFEQAFADTSARQLEQEVNTSTRLPPSIAARA